MIPQNRALFCIIVHYGAPPPTRRLTNALLAGSVPPAKIIVIHHGPKQNDLKISDDRVQIVTPERNEGYAAGINIGLGMLIAHKAELDDIVICLNNDVEISPDTLERVSAWWAENPKPAVAGVKTGIVNLFTGRAHITRSSKLKAKSYKLTYIHGSFLAAPLQVFLKVHFPDTYFLYWEDVVFSRHLGQRGIPGKVMSGVDVRHPEEKPLSEDRFYYLVRNGALFLEHETPTGWRIYWRLLNRLRSLYHALVTAEPKRSLVLRALADARRNVTGKYEPQ